MKTMLFFILAAVLAILIIFGCEKNKEDKSSPFSGSLTSHSACKSVKSMYLKSGISDSLTCINYEFNEENGKLILHHINAGFNCCPDSLFCDITLRHDTIIVKENEKIPQCNCCCLYDLNMEILGVEAKKYRIQFVEPYAYGQEQLNFELDLTKQTEGSCCVVRREYPWQLISIVD